MEQQQPGNHAAAAVNYQCPNCAAPLVFGIESQQWECHFCNTNFSKEDMEGASRQETREEPYAPPAEMFGEDELVGFTCPSCGGSVMAQPNETATFCAYCHNPTVLAGRLQGAYRPALMLPFKKTRQEAVAALQKMCSGKPFLPKVFKDAAAKGEVVGLYVPYWLFGGDYNAVLSANATRVTSWRDSRFVYTKTDTFRVERGGTVPIHRIPVDGSRRMDDKIMEAIEPYRYDELVPFGMEYLSGHVAESYDVSADECGVRYEQRAGEAVSATLRGTVGGNYSTVSVHSVQQHCAQRRCEYVLLPVWTVNAPFEGKTYSFTMNAQTGKMVGVLPVDKRKRLLWFAALGVAVAALAWLVGGFFL